MDLLRRMCENKRSLRNRTLAEFRIMRPIQISSGQTKPLFVGAPLNLAIYLLLLSSVSIACSQDRKSHEFFEDKVAPILIKRCLECHNASDPCGDLNLSSHKGFLQGGESGEDLTQFDQNTLIEKVESGEMPPEEKGVSRELDESEKDILRQWIRRGAQWPSNRQLDLYEFTNEVRGGRDWWSFQPIKRPPIPRNKFLDHPLDAFVYQKQVEQKLGFNRPATKSRWFRRVTFDVTGLPPSQTDLELFEKDSSPDAYEKLVDRLLASPRFGEHHGRSWLDLIRYGDTNGYERDAEKPFAWKYRDWVIDALNSDKPFDLFAMQQLAGDQMKPTAYDNVVGTTMLRVGTWDDEPNDKLEYKYDRLEDLIHVTSTAFLGLTVKCARCHNHKFDPIPQEDYYRLGSIFWPGDLMGNKSELVKGYEVFAWQDVSRELEPIRLLKKGNPRQPLNELDPGFLSVIKELDTKFANDLRVTPDTNRRLEFAKRMVSRKNPLFARVIVNRIWQHYFGRGIVRTTNNFGYKGELPTHPELLDWLAGELIAHDFNLKPIHRLILTSRTYRQDSVPNADAAYAKQVDPQNRFLWRMNRKRLSVESIRDTMLVNSGQINLQMGGRGFTPNVSQEALEGLSKRSSAWQPSDLAQQSRRGVYLFVKRSLIPPLLTTFDFADTTRPCGQRDLTIVSPQALALMNNAFVHAQSEQFALAVMKSADTIEERIVRAWSIALARQPTPEEIRWAKEHFVSQYVEFSQNARSKDRHKKLKRFPEKNLVFHLAADKGITKDAESRITEWKDIRKQWKAVPTNESYAPVWRAEVVDGKPVVSFNGVDQFLEVNRQVLEQDEYTIVVVGHDENPSGHREFFSNWNANGNSTSSVFLGLTTGRLVRFSDQFRSTNAVPSGPFILSAVSSDQGGQIYAGRQLIGQRQTGLTGRNLKTKYVIGTQGNFGHEFQNGWLAELLVFDRGLNEEELDSVWKTLEQKYPSIQTKQTTKPKFVRSPELLALASLCHVLMNTNEMIFVD